MGGMKSKKEKKKVSKKAHGLVHNHDWHVNENIESESEHDY